MISLFNRAINKTISEPEMTIAARTALALGVAYACVAPWFYCKPDVSDEESRVNAETDDNHTLKSTSVRITGLRGLNFVSVTIPKQLSQSVNEYNQGTSRMSPNLRRLPEIQMLTKSTSSMAEQSSDFLTAGGSSATRPQSTKSHSAQTSPQNKTPMKKPPRAHPPKCHSVNSIASVSPCMSDAQTQTDNLMDKQTFSLVGHENFSDVSRASLYPTVMVNVRGCHSPAATSPRSSTFSTQPNSTKSTDLSSNKTSSNVTNFFTKKWKKLSVSLNKSHKSTTITSANSVSGHSTLNQPINLSTAQGQSVERCGLRDDDDDDDASSGARGFVIETEGSKVSPMTGRLTCVNDDFVAIDRSNNQRAFTLRTEIEDYYDLPIDLSRQQSNDSEEDQSACTAFVRDVNQVLQGVSNYLKITKRTESFTSPSSDRERPVNKSRSRLSLRKARSLNFFKNKLNSSKKCNSLPAGDNQSKLRKLLSFHGNVTCEINSDSHSIEQISTDFNQALIFDEYISRTIHEDESTQYIELEQLGNARHIFEKL